MTKRNRSVPKRKSAKRNERKKKRIGVSSTAKRLIQKTLTTMMVTMVTRTLSGLIMPVRMTFVCGGGTVGARGATNLRIFARR